MSKQKEIREGIARKIFEWCKRNGYIVASFEWKEITGATRGLILAVTDIVLEYEVSQGVAIKVEGELPSIFDNDENVISALEYQKKLAGCVKTKPLIEEAKDA